ncbi:GPI transamidase component PIG-T [Zychaea mexicana]|uniref:GPI transamidase component PIG-T n=1 Tax=Zychaea mexicana TaxID=64656 RepID=UPI0022FEBBC3|nr:GPI transamidase component PIG-T [Zychaea mexicana]KAI9469334.1 GPI transamidase component PIG-T [Zychaea mexicana]
MRFLLLLFIVLLAQQPKSLATAAAAATTTTTTTIEQFNEDLTLRSLPDGKLLAHFDFTTHVDVNNTMPGASMHHYRLFPKVIGQVLQEYQVREMHLTFSQGRWKYDEWGYPLEQSTGTGVELWAWMENSIRVDAQWKKLTNTLSGLFCASLNFIDETITTEPALSFRSSSFVSQSQQEENDFQLRYGSLPHENVCTENLTPWIKLLPCKAKSGIAELLNAHKIYNSNFHSMAIHAKSICANEDCTQRVMELKQTETSVLDPVRDSSRRDWSLKDTFDRVLHGACPVADRSRVHVARDDPNAKLSPKLDNPSGGYYDLWKVQDELDIRMTWNENSFVYRKSLEPAYPLISANRHFTGHGQERGGLQITIHNRDSRELPVTYYDSIPWFLKLYLHTLQVVVMDSRDGTIREQDVVQDMYYQPAIDRSRPSMLECRLLLPPESVITLSLDLDKVFLKYTEHRPDANRGFDVGHTIRVYTDTLLVSLPTPDFSMPYNVITLTCTVIALFFGSVFNLLTRSFQVIEEKEEQGEKNK